MLRPARPRRAAAGAAAVARVARLRARRPRRRIPRARRSRRRRGAPAGTGARRFAASRRRRASSTADSSRPSERDPFMRTLAADVRYALRVLLRAPSFALAVDRRAGARHRRQHRHLQHRQRRAAAAAAVRASRTGSSGCSTCRRRTTFPGMPTFSVSPANFYDWQRERTAVRRHGDLPLPPVRADRRTGDAGGRARGAVGAGLLRGRPARSRRSGACSCRRRMRPARHRVVILSDGFWKTPFRRGARRRRPHADARRRGLHGRRRDAGAASRSKRGAPPRSDLWVPLAYTDEERAVRENHNAQVDRAAAGRVSTPQQAQRRDGA